MEKDTALIKNVRFPPDLVSRINDEASRRHKTFSEMVRIYCEQGLDVSSYENSMSQIAAITEQSLEKVIEPYMKRIIALIQKNGKIEAGAYFLLLHELMKGKSITENTLDIVQVCNQLAVGYIKQQNSDVETYLLNAKDLADKAMKIGKSRLYLVDDD